jgi:hypothetical protein
MSDAPKSSKYAGLHKSTVWQYTTLGRGPKSRIGRHKAKAEERGVEWTLTEDEYAKALGEGICHWCKGMVFGNGVGLDRIDNTAGYSVGNVNPCCPTCNMERRTLTYAEYTAVWMVRRMLKGSDAQRARDAGLAVRSKVMAGKLHHDDGQSRGKVPVQPRGQEWREVIADRIRKRESGLNPDHPWPERQDGESDRDFRQRIGTTQEQFAKMMGVARRTLQRREYGRR